jgi:RecB family exonuclease
VPVSPSRLDALETSPLDWFIDDISESAGSLAAGVGTIIHWAMQTTEEPNLDAVWRAVMERWDELFFESPWLERRERATARRLAIGVTEYLADARRSGVQRLAAEERFTLRQGRAVVHGFVDRLERDAEGRIVIVDLKTGRPITNQEQIDGHPQLGAYQLAYRAGAFDEALKSFAGGRAGGAKLLFVREGLGGKHYREGIQAALDETAAAVLRERIDAAVRILSATSFSGPRAVSDHGTLSEAERRLRRVAEIVHD